MSRLPAIFVQIQDAVGAPVPGGKLHTYASGTTTNKATYSDAAKSVPNTNPIIAGADGIVGPVYLIDEEGYKFVEKTAADVTLRTEDGVYSGMITSDSVVTRLRQMATNPVDYGAVGDGVADESSYVQSAIDAVSGEGVVDLLGLTYKCDSQITVPAGAHIRNGYLDFSACTDAEYIKIHGTLATATALTADVAFRAVVVAVTSAAGLSATDIINIYDGQDYTDDKNRGELAEIESIAALNVSIYGSILDAYATASSAAVRKVNMVDDVKLTDLKIKGAGSPCVSLCNCRRARIKDVVFINQTGAEIIEIAGCWDVLIESCSFDGGTGTFTNIDVDDASQFIKILNNHFSAGFPAIEIGSGTPQIAAAATGIPRFVTIRGNTFGAELHYAILVDDCAQHVQIEDNDFFPHGTAAQPIINVQCVDAGVINNRFVSDAGVEAITLASKVPNRSGYNYALRVENNTVQGGGGDISYSPTAIAGGSGTLAVLAIQNNILPGAIVVVPGSGATNAPVTDVHINQNQVLLASGTGILITVQHATPKIHRLHVNDNEIVSSTVNIGGAGDIDYIYWRNNVITSGDLTLNCDGLAVEMLGGYTNGNLVIDEANKIGIYNHYCTGDAEIDNSDVGRFLFCRVHDSVFNTLEIDASYSTSHSQFLTVQGCLFRGDTGKISLDVTGYIQGVKITGNHSVAGDSSTTNIRIVGDAANAIDNGVVHNNTIIEGNYCLEVSNIDKVTEYGNYFIDPTTADISGDFDSLPGVINVKTVTLTAAQVRALAATPQTIVPAETGLAHLFIAGHVQLNHAGNSDFTEPSAPEDIVFNLVDGAGTALTSVMDGTTAVCASADAYTLRLSTGRTGLTAAQAINVPIVLWNNGNEYTGNAHNDNTLVVTVYYIPIAYA